MTIYSYLSGFQILLLLCLIEVKTGFLIGDYYFVTVFCGLLFFKWIWWKLIQNKPL
jgi:hypothetical protein